jgi:hypothetical protein
MQQAKPMLKAGKPTDGQETQKAEQKAQLGNPVPQVPAQALPGEAYGLSVKYFRWGIQQRGYTRLGWRKW